MNISHLFHNLLSSKATALHMNTEIPQLASQVFAYNTFTRRALVVNIGAWTARKTNVSKWKCHRGFPADIWLLSPVTCHLSPDSTTWSSIARIITYVLSSEHFMSNHRCFMTSIHLISYQRCHACFFTTWRLVTNVLSRENLFDDVSTRIFCKLTN